MRRVGTTTLHEEESKYVQLKNHIKGWILGGRVLPGDKIPSEHELAERFGVSRHTVRQAVGELVSEGWLYREQGRGTFVRDRGPVEERWVKASRIGVITTYIVDYIFPHIISGIEAYAAERGHTLSLWSTSNNFQLERRALESALDLGLDGLIIEPTKSTHPNPNIDLYLLMEQRNIPFVMLHGSYLELNASVVALDDAEGAYLATGHLFDLGHRAVGAIFKSDDIQGRARFRGFVRAHQDYRVPIDGSLIRTYTTEDRDEVILRYVDDVFRRGIGRRPTAVVCYNDEIAVKLISQLTDCGLVVPDDVSVTGFDDSALAENGGVPLTTVRHPKQEMGAKAAEMLVGLMEDPGNMWVPREYIFKPALVIRKSTAELSR